jgi:uncharacterized membrane protein
MAIGREVHTQTGLERFVFFSDAVVAIAITLLLLPLVDAARELGHVQTSEFFGRNAFALLAAGVTFTAIAGSWRAHHRLFEHATGYTRLLVRVNFVWLAGIAFLPVATVLVVGSPRDDRLADGVYIGTLTLLMALSRLMEVILQRAGLIAETEQGPGDAVIRWLPVGLRALAFVLAISIPGLGLWALLVVLLEIPVEAVIRARRK